ncbi:HNH endonuclease [Clostridium beijerinckii]|nr:HNH endonuclease [Clostridium beijerinckii]
MAKEYAKSFYESSAWKKCRKGFMQSKHYICERCGGSAYITHHKQHITPTNINNLNIILNWDNLQALCLDCHNVVHGNNATVNGISFDNEGNLIYTAPGQEK